MKGAKKIERPGLSDKDIQEIQEAFELFDSDGSGYRKLASPTKLIIICFCDNFLSLGLISGTIDITELYQAMESLGISSKDKSVLQLLTNHDGNKNNVMEFEEFLDMMTGTLR